MFRKGQWKNHQIIIIIIIVALIHPSNPIHSIPIPSHPFPCNIIIAITIIITLILIIFMFIFVIFFMMIIIIISNSKSRIIPARDPKQCGGGNYKSLFTLTKRHTAHVYAAAESLFFFWEWGQALAALSRLRVRHWDCESAKLCSRDHSIKTVYGVNEQVIDMKIPLDYYC